MLKFGEPPYLECSSKGDKRFSAFYAKLSLANVNKPYGGMSIEEAYQEAKIFEDGSTNLSWKEAKGRKAINQEECSQLYASLWNRYIEEHPELLKILKSASGLSDIFGQRDTVVKPQNFGELEMQNEEQWYCIKCWEWGYKVPVPKYEFYCKACLED